MAAPKKTLKDLPPKATNVKGGRKSDRLAGNDNITLVRAATSTRKGRRTRRKS
jgi:hypothetical protein